MTTLELLQTATQKMASDMFIVVGRPITYKVHGKTELLNDVRLTSADTEAILTDIYKMAKDRSMENFYAGGDDDFSFAINGLSRFRVNAYRQRGSLAAVIRVIAFQLPDPGKLNIPPYVMELANISRGMVLVTGPAGCGKSTTLACMVDYINKNRTAHIITLEDPLEYLHPHNKSIVSQREIFTDTNSYLTALRAALRQSPNVILLGELRDYETMQTALTAGETGHLLLSSLHTIGASNTIDRIIDAFPPNQQKQISIQLSMVLQAVVSQQLVPTKEGTYVPAFEIMTLTPAIRNLLREGKIHQIEALVYSSSSEDMISMDNSLLKYYSSGIITKETAIQFATNPELIKRRL